MAAEANPDAERARAAAREEIPALLYHPSEDVLAALLENPRFDAAHLSLLLERKELSGEFLEEVARRKKWLAEYAVKRRLAFHVHTPRLTAMRMARQLYLMDLVQLSLLPSAAVELRRLAEELILVRLPQLPLGQKLTLARRGSARVAGGLIAEGQEQVARVALDNAFLNEAQILKVLSRVNLAAPVVEVIAKHARWSQLYNVRIALLRHPKAPLTRVIGFLPDLTPRDLKELAALSTLPAHVKHRIRDELARRGGGTPSGRPRSRAPRARKPRGV
jgi:hypothetical protein